MRGCRKNTSTTAALQINNGHGDFFKTTETIFVFSSISYTGILVCLYFACWVYLYLCICIYIMMMMIYTQIYQNVSVYEEEQKWKCIHSEFRYTDITDQVRHLAHGQAVVIGDQTRQYLSTGGGTP